MAGFGYTNTKEVISNPKQPSCEKKVWARVKKVAPISPELLLLKFLQLTYHHSLFLAATLDFTSFFTLAFLQAALFFYSLAVLD